METLNLIDIDNRSQCLELYEFILANCSEAKGSNHQNWIGGYFDHVEEVCNYAQKLYELLSQDRKLDFSLSDALLVLFLHDLEKPIYYSEFGKNIIKSETECKEWFFDKFKLKLKEEHLLAIKYIHGEGDDYRNDKRIMSPLCAFCHCCDIISSRIFFNFPLKGNE